MTFRLYVDGGLASLTSPSCADQPGATSFVCSGGLPPMTPGRHTLELSSVLNGVESPLSTRLIVSLSSTAAVVPPQSDRRLLDLPSSACVGTSNTCYRVTLVTADLASSTTFLATQSGKVFFVESERLVRVIADGVLTDEPALAVDTGSRIVGLAVDDHDTATPAVYVAWTDPSRETVVNVTRFREVQNILGEGAQIVTALPFVKGAFAPLAVGGDGLLYLALPPADPSTGASEAGVILRFTRDGYTPSIGAQTSPTYAGGSVWPTTLATGSATALWSGGRSPESSREIATIDLTSGRSAPLSFQTSLSSEAAPGRPPLSENAAQPRPDPVVSPAAQSTLLVVTDGRLFLGAESGDGRLALEQLTFNPDLTVLGAVQAPDRSIYVSVAIDAQTTAVLSLRQQ
ncbi:MAG TPA: hypothetical protein VGF24_34675 [Vicinamibacterales bacterium]